MCRVSCMLEALRSFAMEPRQSVAGDAVRRTLSRESSLLDRKSPAGPAAAARSRRPRKRARRSKTSRARAPAAQQTRAYCEGAQLRRARHPEERAGGETRLGGEGEGVTADGLHVPCCLQWTWSVGRACSEKSRPSPPTQPGMQRRASVASCADRILRASVFGLLLARVVPASHAQLTASLSQTQACAWLSSLQCLIPR